MSIVSGPGGLSGNDDAGQISAWYVFSALGFYPVAPGMPYYVIGTPSFEEVAIKLENGNEFIVKANNVSGNNIYIQSASLNGIPLEHAWLLHDDIVSGGVLEFNMGPEPNISWASEVSQAPPSLSSGIDTVLNNAKAK